MTLLKVLMVYCIKRIREDCYKKVIWKMCTVACFMVLDSSVVQLS